ncbi:hypothetical protein Lepto7376_2819 [[Leptolyngbya] sp. PCC 7376]|uniref:hypothetical protein n=1 Tax=[Leptolyngbya] sp. PCC 7376 TaxID=111781 RepID=UPI00029EE5EB|nr:hypothetical protein [[Leptolyngbya] sp. PCC 7376]AFY39076.1 hypothetical protein Lepto7376_2819 [[Leptolyngbya] sp. PCC 7376]
MAESLENQQEPLEKSQSQNPSLSSAQNSAPPQSRYFPKKLTSAIEYLISLKVNNSASKVIASTSDSSSHSKPIDTEETSTSQSSTLAVKTSASDSDKNPYTEKTQRIMAWSNLLRSLQPFIWGAIILVVVVPLIGKIILFRSASITPEQYSQSSLQPRTEIIVPAIPAGENVDQALIDAVLTAHESAQVFAKAELDDWEMQLEGRVENFLDWYFGYFTQKKMEFMTPLVWGSSAALHKIDPNRVEAGDAVIAKFTGEFQKQFAKQVLVPQTAQIQLENVTTETVEHYLLALRQNIDQVKVKYHIPQGQWERYLSDISTTIQDTEGNLSNVSLKVLVGGSGYMLTKPLVISSVAKIGSKFSSKFAGTAAAKVAAKTGGTVAAELGTSFVDPIVGVGIFIWDLWDYQHTVKLERPLLKANLMDYLQGVEHSLLHDPETGVMSAIAQIEQGIFQSL